jgi:hypothetical protein
MLLYGLDDLALIESTCLHYLKKSKIILFIVFELRGEYTTLNSLVKRVTNKGRASTAMAQILDTLGFMGRVYEKFILKHM